MRFAYTLPDPAGYADWSEFEGDVIAARECGYDAIELQITDPTTFDRGRVLPVLKQQGMPFCAFQSGGSYATRGNCLSTADASVRARTMELLLRFVDLAAETEAVMVVGSLQGRLQNEPNRAVGTARIVEALHEVGEYATKQRATIAFEPVNQLEVGFHNTIAEVEALVRRFNLPGFRMMVDSFHMNIEERDLLDPLASCADLLRHVHLVETNRNVLGAGHCPTHAFVNELHRLGYRGIYSLGVYTTPYSRRDCIRRCSSELPRGISRT